jgi:thiol-disulfide isomerase/thioredoxin
MALVKHDNKAFASALSRRKPRVAGKRFVMTLVFALAGGAQPAPVAAGHEILTWKARTPDLNLTSVEGATWSLPQHKGKVVLVNFWATWCEPCRAEMPSMQVLADRLGPDKLVVVGVNYQENEMRIQRFLAATPLRFTILLDRDGAAAKAWTRRIFPTSILVGPDGRAHTVVVGEFDWAGDAAEKMVRDLLPR